MRWLSFFTRSPRRPRSTPEQIRAFDEQLERNLQSRKADRAARQERARRGAATKMRQAVVGDRLINEQVTF